MISVFWLLSLGTQALPAKTRLAREHPEWTRNDLLNLGNPAASEWVFRMMKQYIFNTDPLATWEQMDTADTRGLAQSRHIAGLYQLSDRLLAAYPASSSRAAPAAGGASTWRR
jgi:hypothetical protein